MSSKPSRRIIVRATAERLLAHPSQQKTIMKELAAYLLETGMVNDAELILNDLARELAEKSGTMLVSVTSARAMTDGARSALVQSLQAATGAQKVVLQESIDADMLGGLVARTPDAELDASVRTQLKMLGAIR